MHAISVEIIARSGENGRPVSGEVSYSDGKSYGWSLHGDTVAFRGSRRLGHGCEGRESFSFTSARRASALMRALDGEEPKAVVEDYITRYQREWRQDQAGIEVQPASEHDTAAPEF